MTKSTIQLQADLAAIQGEIKRREAIETAYASGFAIEFCRPENGLWQIASKPTWHWDSLDYRVKPSRPKPRRVWLYKNDEGQPRREVGTRPHNFGVAYIELTHEVEAILREHGEGLL